MRCEALGVLSSDRLFSPSAERNKGPIKCFRRSCPSAALFSRWVAERIIVFQKRESLRMHRHGCPQHSRHGIITALTLETSQLEPKDFGRML